MLIKHYVYKRVTQRDKVQVAQVLNHRDKDLACAFTLRLPRPSKRQACTHSAQSLNLLPLFFSSSSLFLPFSPSLTRHNQKFSIFKRVLGNIMPRESTQHLLLDFSVLFKCLLSRCFCFSVCFMVQLFLKSHSNQITFSPKLYSQSVS